MTLEGKVGKAQETVLASLVGHNTPVLCCSFGKDSTVLLHLLRSMGINLPILFHREPFFPKKHAFANTLIEAWDLTVYDYAPSSTAVVKNNGSIEIVGFYDLPDSKLSWMPTGIKAPKDGEPFLCGLMDILAKPKGTFEYPWDLAFIGHKSCDNDPVLGEAPLKEYIYQTSPSLLLSFPLRDFTNEDVWAYAEKFKVPFNDRRYDAKNGYKEIEDITYNNDWYYACTACLDKDNPEEVDCPKFGRKVKNLSSIVSYTEPIRPAYFAEVVNV